jgi:hypothetical protein
MTEKVKKSTEILNRLRETKDNLAVLDQLITEALHKLEQVTSDLVNEDKYMDTTKVREGWITREEAQKLLDAEALLQECQLEINSIDEATKGVEGALTPIMDKIKKKK